MMADLKFLDFGPFILREASIRGFWVDSLVPWLDYQSLFQSSISMDSIRRSVSLISYLFCIQDRSYGTLFWRFNKSICTFQPGAINLAVKVFKHLPDWDVWDRRHQLDDLTRLTMHRRHYYRRIDRDTQKAEIPNGLLQQSFRHFLPIFIFKRVS